MSQIMKLITHNRFWRFILLLVFASTLSGCLKLRMTIHVKPNGSGTLGFALGMTEQAKALAGSQGQDPIQALTQNLGSSVNVQDAKITRWTDGDYEWVQGEIAFKDLNDLEEHISQTNYFESFSVTRQPGIFRDRYILNARLKPLMLDSNTGDFSNFGNIDPSAFIEFQVAVRLPGSIIETNGVFDGNKSSDMLWVVDNEEVISMQATSESWNWVNISFLGAGVILFILATVCVVLLIIYLKFKSGRKLATSQTTIKPVP